MHNVLAAFSAAQPLRLFGRQPRRLSRLIEELNERLSEYTTVPKFALDWTNSEWDMDQVIDGRRPVGEALAVLALVELVNRGLFYSLTQCECKRWFLPRFSHQRFCSERCRKKHHESSKEFKAARRIYMRQYYRLKKSGKVK